MQPQKIKHGKLNSNNGESTVEQITKKVKRGRLGRPAQQNLGLAEANMTSMAKSSKPSELQNKMQMKDIMKSAQYTELTLRISNFGSFENKNIIIRNMEDEYNELDGQYLSQVLADIKSELGALLQKDAAASMEAIINHRVFQKYLQTLCYQWRQAVKYEMIYIILASLFVEEMQY